MSENTNPILMPQAEYARHRNKSPQYIGKLYKAGILVMRGRMVDATASGAVLDDKPSEKTTMDGQSPASYAQARLADMVFRAKLRRLEFDTRQGKLVEAAVVKERWAAILVVIKERILALPDKLAPELTALTDERQVRDNLKREMHAILKAIHEDILVGQASACQRPLAGAFLYSFSVPNPRPSAASGAPTARRTGGVGFSLPTPASWRRRSWTR
jgi:hypothetical protein